MKTILTTVIVSVFLLLHSHVYSQVAKNKTLSCKHASHFKNKKFSPSGAGSNYDVLYHKLEFELDPALFYVKGKISSRFKATENDVVEISFDMSANLEITNISYHNSNLSTFSRQADVLTITLPAALADNQLDSIAISYKGTPSTSEDAFTIATHSGIPVLWTLSEPYGAKDWWVCKQDLNDKIDSIDVFITAPKTYRSVSNGLLISEIDGSENRVTHWKHRHPIAAYLVAVAITNYTIYSDFLTMDNGQLEVQNYVYPESESSARSGTANLLPIIELYNELFIPYPFQDEKYGHAQFNWGGGMEHQTVSFVGNFSRRLLAHELAHQWFGDYITCATWNEIWLNEGFATYLEGLTCEHGLGDKNWQSWLKEQLQGVVQQPDGAVYVSNIASVNRIFNYRLTYQKAGMLLHMLRGQIGDDAFFTGVHNYLLDSQLANSYATTDNLKQHLEATSGRSLQEFFDDWLYGEGYPIYDIHWSQTGNACHVTVNQSTSHISVDFFEMKIPVLFKGEGKESLQMLNHTFSGEQFTVNLDFQVEEVILDPETWLISKNTSITGIEKAAVSDFLIFPNPAGDVLNIQLNNNKQVAEIQLFNISGKKLKLYSQVAIQHRQIDISNLPAGIYLLQIRFSDHTFSRMERVVKY